ncbi:hypothetical protein [Mycobacteroides abscessus]|uniref:hypothetical protein n=1 Tax=Mycobacteroides abscessus TaxID=36809 RepID=UPI0009A755A4|nr:hypothetical protein [Mycobacteroides abscessus]MDO3334053.1 hypothetical protein [Mycobacteroides abscessus subsp. bolletii]SLI70793.1 Uncharacterised protein [Mycobacteroides abscessus subsp. abscessus]
MTNDDRLLRADHIDLRDGIVCDADGIPSFVGVDTKIPLGALGPVAEYEVPDDLNDVPEVHEQALDYWRSMQRRDTADE